MRLADILLLAQPKDSRHKINLKIQQVCIDSSVRFFSVVIVTTTNLTLSIGY